jgi:predicted nucleic acid-binding protein
MVVSNCSPLRYFIAVEQADLLQTIFGEVKIPGAVFQELTHPSAPEKVCMWMKNAPAWMSVQPVISPVSDPLTELLDAGECEAIQLAMQTGPDFILIDEPRGRREAQLRGLKTIGALGVIVEANRRGLLSDPVHPE